MTNYEALMMSMQTCRKDVETILTRLAYRSTNYTRQEAQVQEFLEEECKVNYKGDIVL